MAAAGRRNRVNYGDLEKFSANYERVLLAGTAAKAGSSPPGANSLSFILSFKPSQDFPLGHRIPIAYLLCQLCNDLRVFGRPVFLLMGVLGQVKQLRPPLRPRVRALIAIHFAVVSE